MMRTLSPLRYPGSKNKTYKYIKHLVEVNSCTTYIEPFVGGGSVAIKLLLNNDVKKIIINDYDKALYAFWYAVLYETNNLIDLIKKTEITIEEWHRQKEIQKNKEKSENLLELGFSTLFLNRTNRSGILKAGVIGGLKQEGTYKLDCRFNKEVIIKQNITKTKNSLTFLDPPYYKRGPELYVNFYDYQNHINLANTIKKTLLNKKWILTYDNSYEINELYKEFNKIEYYLNYSVGKKTTGIEYMFFSNEINIGEVEDYLKIKPL